MSTCKVLSISRVTTKWVFQVKNGRFLDPLDHLGDPGKYFIWLATLLALAPTDHSTKHPLLIHFIVGHHWPSRITMANIVKTPYFSSAKHQICNSFVFVFSLAFSFIHQWYTDFIQFFSGFSTRIFPPASSHCIAALSEEFLLPRKEREIS